MLLLWCSFFLGVSEAFQHNLHHEMTRDELLRHFQTSNLNLIPEYDVVYLPKVKPAWDQQDLSYNFMAFQRPVNLTLRSNSILGENFKTFVYEKGGYRVLEESPLNCHYLHYDLESSAAMSFCQPSSMQGFIFLDDLTLEVQPLSGRLQNVLEPRQNLLEVPHIIKKAEFDHEMTVNDVFPTVFFEETQDFFESAVAQPQNRLFQKLTLELALFFDEAAYRIFAPFLEFDEFKIRDMLLAYVNGVQALYHHPSLGARLELLLVRLDIMKNQPVSLPHFHGERSSLLDSFCSYQENLNPVFDENPDHWDMALYVSGLDFFAYENGRKSGVTMGLATVGGVCLNKYSCVIAELGTTNVFGKPYPSAGFTSVYIMAHEIGHNLGMHHDSTSNNCPKEGYIMSPSRGTNGETQWSSCSAEIMQKIQDNAPCLRDSGKTHLQMDHSRFQDNPGQSYTAKKQCEILLRDKDAVVSSTQQLSQICFNLQCRTPHRSGYYFAGPALDGTSCGQNKLCYGGNCVKKTPPKPMKTVKGGWSPWSLSKCNSGCLTKSKGFLMKRRKCNNPAPMNTDEGCEGSSVEFSLCNDDKVCKAKRIDVVEFASQKCREFSKLLPELDPAGAGLQAPHEEARIWMGCAIFCKRADSKTFYTPRIELNDLGVSPYLPDGTWCHKDSTSNYFCLQHHCLPETFVFPKSFVFEGDLPIAQNAWPFSGIPPELKEYFSLGVDGKPISTQFDRDNLSNPKEEDWETNDYVEVPSNE